MNTNSSPLHTSETPLPPHAQFSQTPSPLRAKFSDKRREVRAQNPLKVGLVLLFVTTAIALVQYKIPTILLNIMELFAMDASSASWLMSVFLLVGVFVALPMGGLAARFGFMRLIVSALALALLGAALGIAASFLSSATLLITSRALEGIAFTVVTACGPIAINQCVSPKRIGTAMGLFGNWGTCGSALSSFIVPTTYLALGFAWVWIVVAGITVLAGVILLVFVKDPHALEEAEHTANYAANHAAEYTKNDPLNAQRTDSHPPHILHQYREIFNRNTLLFLCGFISFNMMLLALLSYLPALLQVKGVDATTSGLLTSAPLLISMLSVPAFGVISDKLGKVRPLLLIAMVLFGPCVFLMYTNTGWLLWVGIILLGLIGLGSIGLFLVGWSKVLPRPELVPVGMGVLIFFQCVGQFLGTFIMPLLLGPGLDNTLLAGSIIVLLGLAGSAMLFLSKFR